jgi:PKD repeat protein
MYVDETYMLTLRVTAGSTGCTSVISKTITALAKPTASFRPGSPYPADYQYPAGPIVLDNLIQLPDRDFLKYYWSWREDGSIYDNNFPGGAKPNPIDRIYDWGTYHITQRVVAPNGICFDSQTVTINIVPPQAIPNFDDIPPACMPYEVAFVNTSKFAKAYKWEFGDGYVSTLENPVHTYTDAGEYWVKLTVTGDNMFPQTREKKVVVYPLPQAAFDVGPKFLYVGQPLRATNYTSHTLSNGTPYNVWYRWDWGDGSANDTIESPSHMYLKAGDFTITLTTGTYTNPQCISVKTIPNAVELENSGDIILPNIFKPRPDGEPSDIIPDRGYKNDLFYPPVVSPVRKYHFVVYNRVGQLLYETNDPGKGWTGYFRGRLCDEGMYVYEIEGVFETGQSFKKIGDILLLR